MSASPVVTIQLATRVEELASLERSLREFAEHHGIGEQDVLGVNLVLEELVSNVILHGGHDDDLEHEILIRLSIADGILRIEVEDDGRPFDPQDAPPPDLEAPLEQRPVGGLGLHLVRELVDELDYHRANGQNVTVMSKRIAGAPGR